METSTVLVMGTGAFLGTLVGVGGKLGKTEKHPVVAGIVGGLTDAALAWPFVGIIALGAWAASGTTSAIVERKERSLAQENQEPTSGEG